MGGVWDCNVALNEHNTKCVYSFYRVGRVLCNQKGKRGQWEGALQMLAVYMVFYECISSL